MHQVSRTTQWNNVMTVIVIIVSCASSVWIREKNLKTHLLRKYFYFRNRKYYL